MKSYLSRFAAGTLLIFLGLFAGLFSLFTPFALTADAGVLFALCLLAAALTGAVYALPLGRWHSLATLALAAGPILYFFLRWDSMVAGAQVVFHQVSLGIHQELPGILFYILPEALSDNSYAALVSTEFLGAMLFLLASWLGVWLLSDLPVWPAVGMVCLFPGLGLFVLRQPHLLPLAALLLFLCLVALSRRGYLKDAALGSRRVLTAAAPVCLVMVLLWLLFPAQGYTRNPWVEDLRRGIVAIEVPIPALQAGKANPGIHRFDRLGSPRFSGRTVLTVQTDSQEDHLLLRGYSAGIYTHNGWDPLPFDVYDRQELSFDVTERYWSYPDSAAHYADDHHSYCHISITDVDSRSDYAYVPYFPMALPEDATEVRDSYVTRPDGVKDYTFTYTPQESIPTNARVPYNWDERYSQWVYECYLDVPHDLLSDGAQEVMRETIEAVDREISKEKFIDQQAYLEAQSAASAAEWALAKFTDQRAYRMAQAEAVADYLASFTRYDISTPAPPLGADFVSWFLTGSHQGYCAHYASAATLILREMGIPARFTVGYAVALDRSGGVVKVPDRNAHAWVEIYIDGFGWQPVDVTPPGYAGSSATAQASAAPSPSVSPLPSPSPSPSVSPSASPSPSPSAAPAPTEDPGQEGGDAAPGPLRACLQALLPWVLAVGGVLSAVVLQRRWRLWRRRKRYAQSGPNAAALELYRYLVLAEKRADLPIPQEAAALAKKAAFSQHTLSRQELRNMEGCARKARDACRALPRYQRLIAKYLWCLC